MFKFVNINIKLIFSNLSNFSDYCFRIELFYPLSFSLLLKNIVLTIFNVNKNILRCVY